MKPCCLWPPLPALGAPVIPQVTKGKKGSKALSLLSYHCSLDGNNAKNLPRNTPPPSAANILLRQVQQSFLDDVIIKYA